MRVLVENTKQMSNIVYEVQILYIFSSYFHSTISTACHIFQHIFFEDISTYCLLFYAILFVFQLNSVILVAVKILIIYYLCPTKALRAFNIQFALMGNSRQVNSLYHMWLLMTTFRQKRFHQIWNKYHYHATLQDL